MADIIEGYHSSLWTMSTERCFNLKNITRMPQNTQLGLTNWKERDELLSELGITSAQVAFGSHPTFTYLSQYTNNDFSISFHCSAKISRELKLEFCKNEDLLTKEAKHLLSKDPERFLNNCGDRLIESIEEGVLVILTIRLDFPTLLERQRFVAYGERNPLIFLNYLTDFRNVTINLRAFQLGGDPKEPYFSNEHYCSSAATENCRSYLEKLLNYTETQFPHQITSDNEWGKGMVVLHKVTPGEFLEDLGFKTLASFSAIKVNQDIEKLETLYDSIRRQKTGFDKWKMLGFTGKLVDENSNKVISNLKSFQMGRGASYCFRKPSMCSSIVNGIIKDLKSISYIPQETQICMKPDISLEKACANLLGTYDSLQWESISDFPNEEGDCVAKAVGFKTGINGEKRAYPCTTFKYPSTNPLYNK